MIWLAHALLRLYPRSFRHRYASEIVTFIAYERDARRHRGAIDEAETARRTWPRAAAWEPWPSS